MKIRKSVPKVLFKYLDSKGGQLTLQDCSFKFTPPNMLNDIFECLPARISNGSHLSKREVGEYLACQFEALSYATPDSTNASIPPLLKQWRDGNVSSELVAKVRRIAMSQRFTNTDAISRDVSILSLSTVPDSILMWSHYAEDGKGIVIGIKTATFPSLYRVRYRRNRVSFLLKKKTESMFKVLTTKYTDWKYEKEWRAIADNSKLKAKNTFFLWTFPVESIATIILGPKVSDELLHQATSFSLKYSVFLQKAEIDCRRFSFNLLPVSPLARPDIVPPNDLESP